MVKMGRKMLAAMLAVVVLIGAPALVTATAGSAQTRAALTIPLGEPVPVAATVPRPADIESIRITRELPITHWLPPGEFAWDAEAAAAARGTAIVVVNLRSRTLSVYKGGVELGRSSILYGSSEKPTPLGRFPILERRRDHTSSIYDAPMPHMQRLTWDGVALHGSPRLADNLGTNGCIGLPREFAALLFDVTRVGDEVVIWSGRPGSAT